jgi:hypothetical protein
MCIKLGGGGPRYLPVPPPIQPRLANDTAKASPLPEDKDLLDPDEVADVSYGKNKKPDTQAGRKTGTDALKIPINVGDTGGGGINV